jgi:hypothetical protein
VAATTAAAGGRESPHVAPVVKAKPNAADEAGRQLDAVVFGGTRRRSKSRS